MSNKMKSNIIITTLLTLMLLIYILQIYMIAQSKNNAYENGYYEGQRKVQAEAVNKGFATFGLNENSKLKFEWRRENGKKETW